MALSAEAGRTSGDLAGQIVSKTIQEKKYWYLQFSEPRKKKQIYLGPDTPEISRFVASHKSRKIEADKDARSREELCRMIVQGGGLTVDSISARVMDLLAGSGLFRAGAVLVGSHAFVCYGNKLGVRWPAAIRTQDIDLAYDKTLAVVLGSEKTLDVNDVLGNAQMGFHPVPALNPKHPSTSFKIRGKELHLDILTPFTGKKNPEKPVFLSNLGVAAQPLRYLDYLIEDCEKTVVPYHDGILVNVPQPARFFWHKLIVMQERSSFWKIKIGKDKMQCALLAEALIEQRPSELKHAWRDLGAKNKRWQSYAKKGLILLLKDHPHLDQILAWV